MLSDGSKSNANERIRRYGGHVELHCQTLISQEGKKIQTEKHGLLI